MFQKFKRMCRKAKKTIMQVSTKVRMLILLGGIPAMAQRKWQAITRPVRQSINRSGGIVKYVPVMVKLCYAIAGVVAIIGAISVYIASEQRGTGCQEEDYDGSGACLF